MQSVGVNDIPLFVITERNGLYFVQKRKIHVKFIYSRCIFEACQKVPRSYFD